MSHKSNFIYDEFTVPYISNYYYEAKIYSNKNFKLPLYITDYYQREYMYDDDSMKFSLRIELDDNEPIYLNNIATPEILQMVDPQIQEKITIEYE